MTAVGSATGAWTSGASHPRPTAESMQASNAASEACAPRRDARASWARTRIVGKAGPARGMGTARPRAANACCSRVPTASAPMNARSWDAAPTGRRTNAPWLAPRTAESRSRAHATASAARTRACASCARTLTARARSVAPSTVLASFATSSASARVPSGRAAAFAASAQTTREAASCFRTRIVENRMHAGWEGVVFGPASIAWRALTRNAGLRLGVGSTATAPCVTTDCARRARRTTAERPTGAGSTATVPCAKAHVASRIRPRAYASNPTWARRAGQAPPRTAARRSCARPIRSAFFKTATARRLDAKRSGVRGSAVNARS